MKVIKKFLKHSFFFEEKFCLFLILIFIVINWILLVFAEKIAPPDFYKFFEAAEKIYTGDLKVGISPPLFLIIMYPFGKILSLVIESKEAFIMAGRIIALVSSLGAVWFSYLLLKKIIGKWSLLGIIILVISPWYLKMISFPITGMLYLFFVTVTFYYFYSDSTAKKAIFSIIGGAFTRFEGILLIFSGMINYFKVKKRTLFLLIGFLSVILIGFYIFIPRIFNHFQDIILPQKSYLNIFIHPLKFSNIIYGNLLFFIPFHFPYLVKLSALILIFIFFVYGILQLMKINKPFTLSILVYEILFLVAKGYINFEDPDREFRRIFSGLWIFYLIGFIGGYFLIKKLNKNKIAFIIILIIGNGLLIEIMASIHLISWKFALIALLLVFPFFYAVKGLSVGRIPTIPLIILPLLAIFQFYYFSYGKTETYVVSYANKAAFATAQWLNYARLKEEPIILSYTDNKMIYYYLKKDRVSSKKIKWTHFTVPMRYSMDRKREYIGYFFKELKNRKVDYIVFDNYVVQKPEFLGNNDAKLLLFEERDNPKYFRSVKNLFYKGKNVGYVLKPAY